MKRDKFDDCKVQFAVGSILIEELNRKQYIKRFMQWIKRQERKWHQAEAKIHIVPKEASGELADTMRKLEENT